MNADSSEITGETVQHCLSSDCAVEGVYIIEPENLTDALSMEELQANRCIRRNRALEDDLYSVVYDCADGNSICYIFQYPVKYVDTLGNVKDIKTGINRDIYTSTFKAADIDTAQYTYSSRENAFSILYADKMNSDNSAVVAVKENYSIGLSAHSGISAYSRLVSTEDVPLHCAMTADKNNVIYENVYGNGTHIYYSTTYTGYKEMIVLDFVPQTNQFSFILNIGNLSPKITSDSSILLYDVEKEELVGSFAPLYVYDSSEETKYTIDNYYTINPIDRENGIYELTLTIDEAFLNSTAIEYPVIVDPTFSFSADSSTQDAPVYSGKTNTACGSNYYNHIGYVDSSYQTGYLLLKFPSLKNSEFFNQLSDSRINSVTYNVSKTGGNSSYSANISAYYYTGPSWAEASVTYGSANVVSYTGSYVCGVTMKGNSWYSFDITAAAKAWKNRQKNYDSGLVLKNVTSNTDATYDRILASTEYGSYVNSDYMPYVAVVFNNNSASMPFSSPDIAALHFAQSIYNSSKYALIEYAATIYYYSGSYFYYNVHHGEPHGVGISKTVPSGARYVAYVHTHPNSEDFSNEDKNAAKFLGGDGYVVTPSLSVKRYSDYKQITVTLYRNIETYQLTAAEKSLLEGSLRDVWYGHIANGVCPKNYGCENKTWPNK